MSAIKFGPYIYTLLKKNPNATVYLFNCAKCGKDFYDSFEGASQCRSCYYMRNDLYNIHARTKHITMCASYKEFLTQYGPRPSINHTFTMKKGTRRYAWVLKLPPNPYAGIQKNSSDMYQATHNNKYIGVYATRELARSARAEYIDNLPKSKANIVDMRGVDNSMLHTPIAKGEEALSKEIEADIDEAFGDL